MNTLYNCKYKVKAEYCPLQQEISIVIMTTNSKYILSSALSKIHNSITTCLLPDVQTYKFSYVSQA